MKTTFASLMGAAALSIGTGQVLAHHAFSAEFDSNKPVKLRGTVIKMEWVNPHAWVHLDVKGPDGKVVTWMIEGAAPNAMLRRGFSKNSLPVGTEIIVEGFQAKDGSNTSSGRNLTLPDGRTLFIGSAGTGAPDDTPGGTAPSTPPQGKHDSWNWIGLSAALMRVVELLGLARS